MLATALSGDGLASSFFVGPPTEFAWPVRLVMWAVVIELAVAVVMITTKARWREAHGVLLALIPAATNWIWRRVMDREPQLSSLTGEATISAGDPDTRPVPRPGRRYQRPAAS